MLDAQTKQKIIQKTYEVLARGNELFNANATISKVSFQSNMTTIYGNAGYVSQDGKKLFYVRYSASYAEHDPEFILDHIVAHEVAHVLAIWLKLRKLPNGDYEHDKGWQTIIKALGGDPDKQTDRPLDGGGAKFEYETDGGANVYLNDEEHNKIQNQFKVLRDNAGRRITKFVKQIK